VAIVDWYNLLIGDKMDDKKLSKTFALHIYTPSKVFYDDKAEEIIVPSQHGQMGIMYNTMPIVTVISKGFAKIKSNQKWMDVSMGKGFMEVRDNVVTILVDNCAWGHEILEEPSEEDEEKALSDYKLSIKEHQLAKAQLVRKLARLQATTHE